MIASRKFESFCIDPGERWIFAGDISGQISVIDIEEFSVLQEVQAHVGGVQAITAHPRLPYVAALATDRTVTVWSYGEDARLRHVCTIPLRHIKPDEDPFNAPNVQSTSQAIGFHDTERRIVTRTANAALVELRFDEEGTYRVKYCVRLHWDADLISVRFVKDSDMVLSGSIDGKFILSEGGRPIRDWDLNSNVHWAEHLSGTTYLIASDSRCVSRIDITGERETMTGQPFTRDDLEHVTYNRVSGRAFVGSFDRSIYEIDAETCMPTRVVFRPPFKCRWVKSLERSPSTLLVQCRNGALYKASSETGECLAAIRRTPDALWTAVNAPNGDILITGDGDSLLRVTPCGVEPTSRAPVFAASRVPLDVSPGSYTKRMALHQPTGRLVLGRTDGDVLTAGPGGARRLANLGSAVRDLDVSRERGEAFAACEDGRVFKLDLETGETLSEFTSRANQPFWALAYNQQRNVLAVGERGGEMFVLDADDFSVLMSGVATSRMKRMKWADADTLLFNKQDELHRFNIRTGSREQLTAPAGNTVEDFIWDAERRYLVMISYTCNLLLCDLDTGELLSEVPDQMDYSKGLVWVDPHRRLDAYPLDFMTFGRSGCAHHFRIHDEKILALGPVTDRPSVTD